MADFKTHITTSTVLGAAYGAGAYQFFGIPMPACALAGALCSVSGMLPDLDSDSGVPLRESLAFGAACVPMLLVPTFENQFHWPAETIALASAAIYAIIRFGFGKLLKKYTVHRGMFHSIPAAFTFGGLAFLLCANGEFTLRAYKACAVLIGFFSHLILDEIWSIRFKGGIGLKSSSGTAMKLWGDSMWGNLSCYGKLVLVGLLVFNDPIWAGRSPLANELHNGASTVMQLEQKVKQDVPMPNGTVLKSLAERLTGASPTGTGPAGTGPAGTAAGNTAPSRPGLAATTAPSTFAPQQPSPPLLQQQLQAYAQQQANAAQQAYAAQQQQLAYQQQQYQQWYQQQLYQQQLAQQQAAAYAQYQRQYQQPAQPYGQPQPAYSQPYDPRTQPPQAYQPQPQYGLPPRADYPTTRRY